MKKSINSQPIQKSNDFEDSKPVCPGCGSHNIRKNGHIHNGNQNHQCKDCGRQFVENNGKKIFSTLLKNELTNCYWKECLWLVYVEFLGVSNLASEIRQCQVCQGFQGT